MIDDGPSNTQEAAVSQRIDILLVMYSYTHTAASGMTVILITRRAQPLPAYLK